MELWGWGRKNTADVNSKGELLTYAESFSTAYDAANDGDAYTMDIDGITVGADGNTLAVIENSHSSKELIVTGFELTPNESKDDQVMEVYIGGAFTYLANGTAVVPTNIDSAKSGGAAGGVNKSFYVSDGAASTLTTITAGSIAGRFPMITKGKVYECELPSFWHIMPSNSFYITGAKDCKFSGFISFYYRSL